MSLKCEIASTKLLNLELTINNPFTEPSIKPEKLF